MMRVLILTVTVFLLGAVAHGERLRGFGEVELRLEEDGLLTFVCEDVEHARLLLHKLGRDLSQSATVPARWERVQAGSLTVPVLVRPGLGVFLPMTLGRKLVVHGVLPPCLPADHCPGTALRQPAPRDPPGRASGGPALLSRRITPRVFPPGAIAG